jgi:hypothetical protein
VVAKGQVLVVLEAMKMEHEVRAPEDGCRQESPSSPASRWTQAPFSWFWRRGCMSDAVLYEVRGDAAWITLNQPERRNALSEELVTGSAPTSRRRSPTRACAPSC